METLRYEITVKTSINHLWEVMTSKDHYNKWCRAFGENTRMEGEWGLGNELRFLDPNIGGTLAKVISYEYPIITEIEHIATLSKDGEVETTGNMTEKWIGSTEKYILEEVGDGVKLIVEMKTDKAFKNMFDSDWPRALGYIKQMFEE